MATNRNHPRVRVEDVAYLERVASLCPEVQEAMELARSLCAMVRERNTQEGEQNSEEGKTEELEEWLTAAQQSAAAEIRSLAGGLRADSRAVGAALSLPWSNGQVEGQVTRLKLLKRQMYGRASFALLKARVLHQAEKLRPAEKLAA